MDPADAKARLRAELRRGRREREHVDSHGRAIAEHVTDLEPVGEACEAGHPIACYVARSGEPPTEELRRALRAAGATVLLPRVEGSDLVWCVEDESTEMAVNPLGIAEPTGQPVDLADVEPAVWIIPALAIDADGYRLGQGGGFYDRALSGQTADGRAPIIAVVFEDEMVHEVPREEHDHRVDVVVTPERVRWLSMPD
jgi:5,10-methenyltetrahydrofolate synthetase